MRQNYRKFLKMWDSMVRSIQTVTQWKRMVKHMFADKRMNFGRMFMLCIFTHDVFKETHNEEFLKLYHRLLLLIAFQKFISETNTRCN